MIDKVFIYEVHYSNFNRYVVPWATYLIENKVAKEVIMIYDRFTKSNKIKSPDNPAISSQPARTALDTARLKNGGISFFFNYSYRIPDLYWTYHFKKAGVYTYQMQHGMYAEFLERSFFGYFSAFNRKATYLQYLLYFLFNGRWTIFQYLLNKDFIKSFVINEKLSRKKKKIAPVRSDHLLVWGDYWKEWFKINHFYENEDHFTTVGNPDYHTFIKNKKNPPQPDNVCYIAQTMVEDGRMERAEYKKIIDDLADALKERLLVKLHPRSDKEIFQKVLENAGKITYDFPVTGVYIGHYSSLLALAANQDSRVYLLEINNEEIPEYFTHSADGVFSSVQILLEAISNKTTNPQAKDISFYFENMEAHPFQIIADDMLNRIS
jgi:hypothetical protein